MPAVLLSFITSKAGIAALVGVLLLSVFGIQNLRLHSAQAGEKSAKAELAQMIASAKAHQATAQAISVASQGDGQKAQTVIVTRYKTLAQRVAEVPERAWRDCVVPGAMVSIWNSGAAVTP